jgi:hypothetical protein
MEEASAKAAEAKDMLESAKDEEQEYFDNMPENMQQGDKGSTAESAVDALDNAVSATESFTDELDEAAGVIQEVIDKLEGDATSNLDEAESSADDAANG